VFSFFFFSPFFFFTHPSSLFSHHKKKMATSVKPGATWKKTDYPSIKNPDFPVEVAGFETFNNLHLASVILGAPFILVSILKLPFWSYPVLTILLALPIFAAYFTYGSQFALPLNNRVQTPGKKVEYYITIVDPAFQKYKGKNRIPMETFFEAYFDGKVTFLSFCLSQLFLSFPLFSVQSVLHWSG